MMNTPVRCGFVSFLIFYNTNGFVVPSTPSKLLSAYVTSPRLDSFESEAIDSLPHDSSAIPGINSQNSQEFWNGGAADDYDDDDDVDVDESPTVQFVIPEELANMRIDAAVASLANSYSRSFCGNLVASGKVFLVGENGEHNKEAILRKSEKVKPGQIIEVHFPPQELVTEIIAQNLPLNILFEDEHMIVLNKDANVVVHPAAGNWDGTLVNALAYHLQNSPYGKGDFLDSDGKFISARETGGRRQESFHGEAITYRPGIVHRLDKGTTGVIVVAKTAMALANLSQAFASRNVQKTYLAITVGNPGKRVTIDKPIGRHPIHRQRMRVVPDPHNRDGSGMAPKDRISGSRTLSAMGRRALSFVDTIAFDGKLSLVEVRIATGRTHQIRVHLQDRHTPIYGDDLYGLKDWNQRLSKTHQITRPLLHAFQLKIDHPVTGVPMMFQAPLAEDMLCIARAIHPEGEIERPDIFNVQQNAQSQS